MLNLNNFNEQLIIAATNYARHHLKIDESLWVFLSKGELFKSNKHSGRFEKDVFAIRYNQDWLKTAETDKIIRCAFHEVFHAFQFTELTKESLGLKSNVFTAEELKQLAFEFNDENYDDTDDSWGTYLAEQQAESYAEALYHKFLDEEKSIDQFIEKYHELYRNKE